VVPKGMVDAPASSAHPGEPEWRSVVMTTLMILLTLTAILGLALEAVNGNGGGHGLAPALEVLRQGSVADKLKALQLLARLAGMQVMPDLVQALRDDDGRVRAAAQEVMWTIWLRSGNDEIDALMSEGIRLMEAERYPEAVELFTQIIARAPTFAEGYNKRATVYYLMLDFDKSIADIHRTLELNPVHFGALSGMGLCYLGLVEPRQALGWFERAIAVNPDMDTIQSYIQQLREFLRNQTL
jgi:tetratricopeptide (TPR) repeat protein